MSVQILQQSEKIPEQKEKEFDVSDNVKNAARVKTAKALFKPNFVNLKLDAKPMEPVIDVLGKYYNPNPTVFKIRTNDKKTMIPPTPEVLVSKYWSKLIVEKLVESLNKYWYKQKEVFPDLTCWKNKYKKDSRPFTVACMYHFLALLYYFGLLKLPSKRDYLDKSQKYLPKHQITQEMQMTRDRFFMWRHFHVDMTVDTDDIDDSEDTIDNMVKQNMERVQ